MAVMKNESAQIFRRDEEHHLKPQYQILFSSAQAQRWISSEYNSSLTDSIICG